MGQVLGRCNGCLLCLPLIDDGRVDTAPPDDLGNASSIVTATTATDHNASSSSYRRPDGQQLLQQQDRHDQQPAPAALGPTSSADSNHADATPDTPIIASHLPEPYHDDLTFHVYVQHQQGAAPPADMAMKADKIWTEGHPAAGADETASYVSDHKQANTDHKQLLSHSQYDIAPLPSPVSEIESSDAAQAEAGMQEQELYVGAVFANTVPPLQDVVPVLAVNNGDSAASSHIAASAQTSSSDSKLGVVHDQELQGQGLFHGLRRHQLKQHLRELGGHLKQEAHRLKEEGSHHIQEFRDHLKE